MPPKQDTISAAMSSSSAQQSKSSAAATNLKTKTKAQAEEATPTSATVTSTIEQVLRAAAIASIALMLLRAADERMVSSF